MESPSFLFIMAVIVKNLCNLLLNQIKYLRTWSISKCKEENLGSTGLTPISSALLCKDHRGHDRFLLHFCGSLTGAGRLTNKSRSTSAAVHHTCVGYQRTTHCPQENNLHSSKCFKMLIIFLFGGVYFIFF